ncbi:MAG: undecaprenyl-diphosphate phosphatase [Akkermansia sp.]|nr:undecaprenyl-diphosphate phosphatase [Akkermansia sp.]MBQ8375841.1 undecaprenyl-diphosphate phosphatase [Akkermansia sp.]
MTILQSLILGLVEGLTEYLPVSSTGHLIITQYLLGLEESDALNAYSVCIQSGAILAVLNLYFARVREMWRGVCGKNPAGLKLGINLLLGFIPAMVIGFFLAKPIKDFLFNAETVLVTWALGGIVILIFVRYSMKTGKGRRHDGIELEDMSWKQALTVGFMQCIAMCPGTSRSLMTMLGGLMTGLSMAAAVEFSFLLGLITLGAATVYDFMKYGSNMVAEIGWGAMLAGTFMSWLSAIIAVKWMVSYLKKHGLSLFGWYRIAAALVMLVMILHGLKV